MRTPYEELNRGNYGELLLKKVTVNGNLCVGYGEIFITQLYQNIGKEDIDGVYVFPIPDTAIISGFEAEIGGRTLKASVEDKLKANKIYENAEQVGDNTFSLEELSPHFFKISIGKIISGETVKIKFSYIDELDYEDDVFKLTIPAVSEPKILKNVSKINLIKDKIIGAASRKKRKNEDFEFKANIIVESLDNLSFKSPYHDINIEREGDTITRISLDEGYDLIDKDFILFMKEEEPLEADGMIYEYKKDDVKNGVVYIRMVPKLDKFEIDKSKSYVFLIDISYTMKGEKLEQAKDALQLCLRNLSEGDTFDIIAMGDTLINFSKGNMVEFNADSLRQSSNWIDELETQSDADIFSGIRYSLEKEEGENTILIFTDNQVDEEEEILSYVKENIGNNRIFTFGVGDFANNYFLNKLAHESLGKAEFIDENERIEDVVLRQFNRIQNPQVKNIKINWGKLKVNSTYPRTIEYMYDREIFPIFASVTGDVEGKIILTGDVNGKQYIKEIDIDNFSTEENASLLRKVWSRKRIKSIEIGMKMERSEKRESMRKKVIELSKNNGLISRETTFILMELREEPVLGIQLKNIIPIKVNEKTLGEKLDSKSKTGFYYRTFENDLYNNSDNSYLNKKYPREKLLRIIAKNQFADGSFVDYEDSNIEDKIETTAMVILAFLMGKESIDIYLNQLNKAAIFLCKNCNSIDFNLRFDIVKLTILALSKIKKKRFIKDKYIDDVDNAVNNICDIMGSKDSTKDVLKSLIDNSFNKDVAQLFTLSEDGKYINEKIVIDDERNSIFNMAKLSVLMTFKN